LQRGLPIEVSDPVSIITLVRTPSIIASVMINWPERWRAFTTMAK
jgi:hypothetical protein